MFIEKSPYYMPKAKNNLKKDKPNMGKQVEVPKFLKWFKGLINPLQNLPIISGIYSSINSKNQESDRDLVQNSLGGFLYGGPIGAISGFGNWVFNKVFDKTPSELFLEVTGVSKLWEKKNSKNPKLVSLDSKNLQNHKIEPQKKITENISTSEVKDRVKSFEFIYPKWNPEKIDKISKKNKNLSLINSLYNKSTENLSSKINIKA